MTSEVLILNKRAVVLGADSAVTTSGGGDHPRYSKSATKIFELCKVGSVAAAIYGNANIDLTPWEIAIKLFRHELAEQTFQTAEEYGQALLTYLGGNTQLAPDSLRASWIEGQFDQAMVRVLQEAQSTAALIFDEASDLAQRQVLWQGEVARINGLLEPQGIWPSLSEVSLQSLLQDLRPWTERAQQQIDAAPKLSAIGAQEIAELAHKLRYIRPDLLLSHTGLVIAGYGDGQIFPAYHQWHVFGHVGDELCYRKVRDHVMDHQSLALIEPLAKVSMIQMFTDGFGPSLEEIIDRHGKRSLEGLLSELRQAGVNVPQDVEARLMAQCHKNFSDGWKQENWRENYSPLISVLQSLSVQEMAHLAESLLGLESLKERVTSPSETVGGPIDVAAITKSEGLVWIKRKHYFDADINMRYAARLNRSFE